MTSSAFILRLILDVLIAAGIAHDLRAAKAFIEQKLQTHRDDDPDFSADLARSASFSACARCSARDPARQAAMDGLAGAVLQISEHLELLAEPPQARTLVRGD